MRAMLKTVKNRELHHMINDQLEEATEGTLKEINREVGGENSRLSKLTLSNENSVSTVTDNNQVRFSADSGLDMSKRNISVPAANITPTRMPRNNSLLTKPLMPDAIAENSPGSNQKRKKMKHAGTTEITMTNFMKRNDETTQFNITQVPKHMKTVKNFNEVASPTGDVRSDAQVRVSMANNGLSRAQI